MTAANAPCTLERLHTHDVEPALRFDAWRERAHLWVDLQPLPPGALLEAELRMLRGGRCVFGTMHSSAYEMRAAARRMAHAPGMVVLSLIQSGEMRRDATPGEPQRVMPGVLGLYDPRRMGSYRWSNHSREAFLALPRDEAQAALGREPGNLLLTPERCALAPVLAAQLNHLAQLVHQPQRVNADEYAELLDATRALALLTLRHLGRLGTGPELPDLTESLHAGRRAAALRFMEANAHRHDLSAADIARGAGCSRTRLYAAFAAQGQSVMDTLRDLRLQRARALIEQTPRLHVGALAWRVGFDSPSGFSKLFRAHFGQSPTEWHRQAWASARR